jgi:hypothetical protein
MCRTSSPPRRDLYELTQTLQGEKQKSAAEQGGFLVPESRPRIGHTAWMAFAERRTAVFNANYAANGERLLDLDKPWTVLTPEDFRAFTTYAEAATYAFKGMTK